MNKGFFFGRVIRSSIMHAPWMVLVELVGLDQSHDSHMELPSSICWRLMPVKHCADSYHKVGEYASRAGMTIVKVDIY